MGNNVLFQLIGFMLVIGDKEGIVVCPVLDLAQRGNHLRFVAVADIIFFAIGHPGAVLCGVSVVSVE